jgi:hypothetical protein
VAVPSGTARTMGVFVNNSKIGTITSSETIFSGKSLVTMLQPGTASIELRDSEGTAELDVDYLMLVFFEPASSYYPVLEDNISFSLFPNPVIKNEPFFIDFGGNISGMCIVEILSLTGRSIYRKVLPPTITCLEINNVQLTGSMYIVGVTYNRKTAYRKLIHYM